MYFTRLLPNPGKIKEDSGKKKLSLLTSQEYIFSLEREPVKTLTP